MSIELSISIPTFNRVCLLEESLAAHLPECAGRSVEICVSNNASTDGTAALLARHPRVRSITQPSNIGIDRNILAAIRMGFGRYVLPIGDDEVLLPGAIDRILAALRAAPDMLILNAAEERIITDRREAFELCWDKMPLGGFVIRSEYAAPHRTDRYLGTWHAYSGGAWDYLAERRTIAVHTLPGRLVEFRKTRKAYAAFADVVHFRAMPKWFDLLPPEYGLAAEEARRTHRRQCTTPRALLHFGAIWLSRKLRMTPIPELQRNIAAGGHV